MDEHMSGVFNDVINELTEKIITDPEDSSTYNLILKQIEFLQDCLVNEKDMLVELNGRELNFSLVASRNIPGTKLEEKIGEISMYIDEIYDL